MPAALRDALGERYVEPAIASAHTERAVTAHSTQKKERVLASVASVASERSGTKPWGYSE